MASLLDVFGFLAVILRGLTLALAALVIGSLVFSAVSLRPLRNLYPADFINVTTLLRRWALGSALALLLVHAFRLFSNTAILMDTAELRLSQVAGANFFLSGVATLSATLIIVAALSMQKAVPVWLLAPAVVILGAESVTSHAAARLDHQITLAIATVVHQAATAVWIGGLPFWLMAINRCREFGAAQQISKWFSLTAQISVASLVGGGLTLAWFYVGSPSGVYGTTYGLMMTAKIVLLGFLSVLAYFNFRIVHVSEPQNLLFWKRLRRFGEAEIGIGFTVILAAASLTSQPPAVDLPNDRATAYQVAERLAPRWPRLETPPLSALSPSTLQQWKQEHKASNDAYVPGSHYAPSTPGDIAWSEYNHHWAGVVVLAMGILAVLSRSGGASWAKHWPLAFVGLAVFLFLRADPENWPLGPNGFLESFKSADVLQHRMFVVMILLFAAFEWGVQTGRLQSRRAALLFPLICAVGGAVLLTHMHALSNIKEELLIEYSHVPLAIFAVVAGWTRWLELRLPPADRLIPSRIWPVCFVLIGLVLVFYREA